MTDEQMLAHIRRFAHWTTEAPWKEIGDRFEELIKKENKSLDKKDERS
jgi:hypothetical protein